MSGKEELARLAYTIGKEVADNVGKKAAPVVAKGAKKVEDWVFKKKPNEMSGNEYLEKMNYANHGFAEGAALNPNARVIKTQWKDQLKDDPILVGRPGNTALTFAKLENANIPRKYTGKVAKGLLKNKTVPSQFGSAQSTLFEGTLSRGLKGMNESQRETLISLLPEWDFSSMTIDDLVNAAKNL